LEYAFVAAMKMRCHGWELMWGRQRNVSQIGFADALELGNNQALAVSDRAVVDRVSPEMVV